MPAIPTSPCLISIIPYLSFNSITIKFTLFSEDVQPCMCMSVCFITSFSVPSSQIILTLFSVWRILSHYSSIKFHLHSFLLSLHEFPPPSFLPPFIYFCFTYILSVDLYPSSVHHAWELMLMISKVINDNPFALPVKPSWQTQNSSRQRSKYYPFS